MKEFICWKIKVQKVTITQNFAQEFYSYLQVVNSRKQLLLLTTEVWQCRNPFAGSLTRCSDKEYVFDECNRQCSCINNQMKDCYRIRQEFSKMPLSDRLLYINAYLQLSTLPQFNESFQYLVQLHVRAFSKGVHKEISQFLAWHRKYVHLLLRLQYIVLFCLYKTDYWHSKATIKPRIYEVTIGTHM